jgi:hypothetical protein
MLQNVKKALANPEPSTHGAKRRSKTFAVAKEPLLIVASALAPRSRAKQLASFALPGRECALSV